LARSLKAKRQIKKHIAGYQDERRGIDVADILARILYALCALVLAFALPVATFCASANVIFRIPDLYNFELSRSEILKEAKLDVTAAEVAELMSNYMQHQTEEFSLTSESGSRTVELFSFVEKARMQQLRALLDDGLSLLKLSAALAAAAFLVLTLTGKRRRLRYGFRGATAVFLCLIAFAVAVACIAAVRDWALGLFGIFFLGDERLLQLFGSVWRVEAMLAVIAVALIQFVAISSASRRLFREQERMFA